MPDGTQAIFISKDCIQIGGAQTKALDKQIMGSGDYFGICFFPGALRHFFKLNLSEITDQFVESHYFPCRNFPGLHNQIYQSNSFSQRARICERWLLNHFKPQPPGSLDHALDLIYLSVGNIEINKLADKVGMSSRHLNRLFKLHTGLSSKTFSQIVRIQSACKLFFENPDSSLKLSVELGFFDQAHLLKEYKKRLLMTPRSLFNRFMSDFYNKEGQ